MSRKIGEGHASGMLRLGLKELRNAVNPSRDSIADSEVGLYGTLTQGEIAQARNGPGDGPEQESLTLGDLRKEANERREPDRVREREGIERDGLEREGLER
jgi:hypothetical protein